MSAALGSDAAGSYLAGWGNDFLVACKFVATSSFTATRVLIYGASLGASLSMTLGIYDDSSGVINTLLRDTNAITVTSVVGWWEATLDSPLSIVNGTAYWLGENHDTGDFNGYSTSGTTDSIYRGDTYSAGTLISNPTSPSAYFSNQLFSIYAAPSASIAKIRRSLHNRSGSRGVI